MNGNNPTNSRSPSGKAAHPGQRAGHQDRTRTTLLDAAEELFADRSFYGVSVRDITNHAGTRLAAVSDCFGGKESLFAEVLLRRLHPLNADRRTRLAALPTAGPRTRRLRALIDAFAEPMLRRAGESAGWRHYFRLTAQLANTNQPVLRLVAEDYNAIATEFIEHLRLIFPGADQVAVHDAYLYLVAVTVNTFAATARLDSLTHGRLHAADLARRYASLRPFLEGGVTRLVGSRPPPQATSPSGS
ncbi:MAG TPA: TetR/AcrR family transcriptional regulator [Rugosimonospora sp.]|nr:TetR/AcrR family transcriptional regulator [Rugosimonospora sp.]